MFSLPLTAHAELRPLEPYMSGEFLAHMDRAREHISPWVSPSFVAGDLEEAAAVLRRHAGKRARDEGGIWGIWLEGTLVGGVLLVSFDLAQGVCEAGCWLEPGAEGRGLVTRAAERIIDWAVTERGIQRVEWRTDARNARSIGVARRLGMVRDGTLRQVFPRDDRRADIEIWSVLAGEWRARGERAAADKAEIDELTAAFFRLFTNTGGLRPDCGRVHRLFVPGGIIVKGGPNQEVHDLDSFAEPRQRLLTSGELVEFTEEETWERTEIFGDVARRLCRYRKSGILAGEPFTGTGTKSIHFLRTADGWRMTALTWDDDR
ncbi:GNAT family N-acetyltransferase [Sphaerisporangium fuscum]|uniref:GNAT family N-acetyltransferase n=1 Tax=Sphaerisporangium fuscum TaxID=2835868 RepID=UPI0027E33201|nr:GNAT family protein [Sphaerisporangium fuscum]